MSLRDVFHPINTRFGQLWSRRYDGLGPILAGRPSNFRVRNERVGELIAYNHMDPVRSGVVDSPAASTWTSHRAYIGVQPAPPWLDRTLGLEACGLENTTAGRRDFDAFVRSSERLHWQGGVSRCYEMSDDSDCPPSPLRPTRYTMQQLVELVSANFSVASDRVVGASLDRRVCRARRVLAQLAADLGGHAPVAIARYLGRSGAAVSKMLNASRSEDYERLLVGLVG